MRALPALWGLLCWSALWAQEPTRVVQGVVRGPDGAAMAGATVVVMLPESAWPDWRSSRLDQAITGADGAFQFRVPHERNVLIQYEHPKYAGDLVEVQYPVAQVELPLRSGFALRGVVNDQFGAPVVDATVILEGTASARRRPRSVKSAAGGAFLFDQVPAGQVRLHAYHPAWQQASSTLNLGATRRVVLTFEQSLAPLPDGLVVGAGTLAPIASALVEFLPAGGSFGWQGAVSVRTREDGLFSVPELVPGRYLARTSHPNYGTMTRGVTLGRNAERLLLELVPNVALAGQLTTSPEAAVALLGLQLELQDSGEQYAYATVGADGAFAFSRRVAPGPATLRVLGARAAFASSQCDQVTFRVPTADDLTRRLAVVAAKTMHGRVVDERAQPVVGAVIERSANRGDQARSIANATAQFQLLTAGSAFLDLLGDERDQVLAVSGADGSFTLAGLPQELSMVRFRAPGLASRWLRISMAATAQTELGDVTLLPGKELRGSVTRGGQRVAGAVVVAFGRDAQVVATTDVAGEFRLVDLAPGPYRMRARLPARGGVVAEQAVVLQDGDNAPLRMELPVGRVLRGVVQGKSGQGLAWAMVAARGGALPVVTDEQGRFELEVPEHTSELHIWRAEHSTIEAVPPTGEEALLRVTLATPPTCTLTGELYGLPQRKRLSGVLVRVTTLSEPPSVHAAWVETSGGVLRWSSCPTGKVRVELIAEGYAPVQFERDLAAMQVASLGELLFENGARVCGKVVDERGAPIGNAVVMLGTEPDLVHFLSTCRSDAEGLFTLAGVAMRSRQLVVTADGFATALLPLKLPQDVLSAEPVLVRLQPGASVEVHVPPQASSGSGFVQLLSEGRVLAGAMPDEHGRVTFRNRRPGTYELRLVGSSLAPLPVEVQTNQGVVQVSF